MKDADAEVAVDVDPLLGYETNSVPRRFFNFFFIPLLNYLPRGLRSFIRKTHVSAEGVIDKATSHEALEILYKHGEKERSRNLLQHFFHYLWFNTNNPKAVRNRLRLVTRELELALREKLKEKDEVSLLSIASGSARAVVDALSRVREERKRIKVTFLDKNERAHLYSKKLIEEKGISKNHEFRWIADNATAFPGHYGEEERPDIIEVVGLLDYFTDEKTQHFFSLIREYLAPGGISITANIRDNRERKFIERVVGWKMIYREPVDFYRMAKAAGFAEEKMKILIEPMKIHFVKIARK